MRKHEEGAGGALIAVILILIALVIIAVASMNRTTSANADRDQTVAKLAIASTALENFAGAALRLPCPADPGADTGVEVPNVPNGPTCQFGGGTLPWKTIGMRRDDSFDSWGRKISYRVYTGSAGSLTQPGGASMTDCDTVEAFPAGPTPTAGSSGGLCRPTHDTLPDDSFFRGKGFRLTDFGVAMDPNPPPPPPPIFPNGVAYVLISHGVTGLGGYTASGVQLAGVANGPEMDNTKDTGPFTIRAFSDQNTGATENGHFDDLLAYRTVADLAKRANLAARPWPDTILSSVVFDKATVTAALGSNPGSDTGKSTIAFNNGTVSASAFDSGGAQDISFMHGGGNSDAIGGVSGGGGLLSSGGGEGIRLDFAEDARQFAFTVDQFDDNALLHERLELRFFEVNNNTTTLKGIQVEPSCAANGKVTSFSVDACAPFNRVEIRPIAMTDGTSPSSFSLAEIRSCVDSVTCQTSLQSSGNVCSKKVFTPCSIGTNDTSVLAITLANPNNSDMTGVAFTDSYPASLVNTASASGATTCAGGVVTAANGGASVALSGGTVPRNSSCTVTINVTAATPAFFPAPYNNATSVVTTASSGTLASVSGTMSVLLHPAASMTFTPAAVSQNAPSILAITLTNANATAITGVAFTDTYPTGLANVANSGASTTCGGVVVADNSNPSPHASLSGGTIPAGATCTVTFNVTGTSIGTYTTTLAVGALTSGNAGANTAPASASLTVN